jgi:hypothetical protein
MKNVISKIKPLIKIDKYYNEIMPCAVCGERPKLETTTVFDKELNKKIKVYSYQHPRNGCKEESNRPMWRYFDRTHAGAVEDWNKKQLELALNIKKD